MLELNISNNKYNSLIAIRFSHKRSGRHYWVFLCECGKEKIINKSQVINGNIKSCGCLLKRVLVYRNTITKPNKNIDRCTPLINRLFRGYKNGAKNRGLDFNLSKEEFCNFIQNKCFFCGELKSNSIKDKYTNHVYEYNGIDRLDNTLGYSIKNCVSCCVTCNRMKMDMSLDNFLNHIKKIMENKNE